MAQILSAMISVLLAWSALALIFVGLGLLIRRSFALIVRDAQSLLTSLWIGWASAICFLQLWHFIFKVDWRVLPILTVGSAAGLLWNRQDLWHTITKKSSPEVRFGFMLAMTAIAMGLANRAIGPALNADSGLYHFTSVRWATSFPIVPGLGNLHYRLAFNSSYFLYVAALDIGAWVHESHHLANGFLLLVLLTQILFSVGKLVDRVERLKVYEIFDIMLLPAVLKEALSINVSSPSPDLAVFVLGVVVSRQLLVFLVNSHYSRRESGYAVFWITTLACVGITVKLSFLVLGLATSLLAVIVWFVRDWSEDRTDDKKALTWAAIFVAAVLVPWMTRGVILSGYIAYPAATGSFPVEWRIPESEVVQVAQDTRAWARQPGGYTDPKKVLSDWGWLAPWAYRVSMSRFDVVIPLMLAFAGCIFTIFYRDTKNSEPKFKRAQWSFLLPSLVSLVFWFFAAPDPRFAGASFWVLGAGAVTLAAQELGTSLNRRTIGLAVFICCAIVGVIVTGMISGKAGALRRMTKEKNPLKASRDLSINRMNPGQTFRSLIITEPGEDSGFYATPLVFLDTVQTRYGLTIYVPKEGTAKCWDAPLPCARRAIPNLRLRQEGNISSGFILDPKQRDDS
jgi:hypothetical protein